MYLFQLNIQSNLPIWWSPNLQIPVLKCYSKCFDTVFVVLSNYGLRLTSHNKQCQITNDKCTLSRSESVFYFTWPNMVHLIVSFYLWFRKQEKVPLCKERTQGLKKPFTLNYEKWVCDHTWADSSRVDSWTGRRVHLPIIVTAWWVTIAARLCTWWTRHFDPLQFWSNFHTI